MRRSTFAGIGLLGLVVASNVQAQAVASFADVAGSWRGHGRQSGIDTTIVIGRDGSWTTSSKIGTESGQGSIKDGAFLIEWKGGRGNMQVTRAGADAIAGKARFYNGSRWVSGLVDATRCARADCTDKGPKDY